VKPALVSSTVCFGWTFTVFPQIFEARSTHVSWLLLDTCHPAAFPADFRPWCQKLRSCRSPELGAWSSCARAPLLSNCVCRPCFTFSGRAWRRLGSTAMDLLLGASSCGACPTRAVSPVKLPPYSTAGNFLGFSVFVLCIFRVTMYSLPMCGSNFIEIFIVRELNCNSNEIWDSA
jgi:hypothetical protein